MQSKLTTSWLINNFHFYCQFADKANTAGFINSIYETFLVSALKFE